MMYTNAVQWKRRRSDNVCNEGKPRPARRDEKMRYFETTEVVGKRLCMPKKAENEENERLLYQKGEEGGWCFTKD